MVAGLRPGTLLKKRLWACNFIKKEPLAQVFSCEFCEISKNTFFTFLQNTSGGCLCMYIKSKIKVDISFSNLCWIVSLCIEYGYYCNCYRHYINQLNKYENKNRGVCVSFNWQVNTGFFDMKLRHNMYLSRLILLRPGFISFRTIGIIMLLIAVLMFFRITLCRFAIAANKINVREIRNTLNLSDWMGNLPKKLTMLPLTQLVIPGTHDSGAYDLDVSLPIAKGRFQKSYPFLRNNQNSKRKS